MKHLRVDNKRDVDSVLFSRSLSNIGGWGNKMNKIAIITLIVVVLLVDFSTAQCPIYCACVTVTRTVDCRPTTSFRYSSIPDDAPVTTRIL